MNRWSRQYYCFRAVVPGGGLVVRLALAGPVGQMELDFVAVECLSSAHIVEGF